MYYIVNHFVHKYRLRSIQICHFLDFHISNFRLVFVGSYCGNLCAHCALLQGSGVMIPKSYGKMSPPSPRRHGRRENSPEDPDQATLTEEPGHIGSQPSGSTDVPPTVQQHHVPVKEATLKQGHPQVVKKLLAHEGAVHEHFRRQKLLSLRSVPPTFPSVTLPTTSLSMPLRLLEGPLLPIEASQALTISTQVDEPSVSSPVSPASGSGGAPSSAPPPSYVSNVFEDPNAEQGLEDYYAEQGQDRSQGEATLSAQSVSPSVPHNPQGFPLAPENLESDLGGTPFQRPIAPIPSRPWEDQDALYRGEGMVVEYLEGTMAPTIASPHSETFNVESRVPREPDLDDRGAGGEPYITSVVLPCPSFGIIPMVVPYSVEPIHPSIQVMPTENPTSSPLPSQAVETLPASPVPPLPARPPSNSGSDHPSDPGNFNPSASLPEAMDADRPSHVCCTPASCNCYALIDNAIEAINALNDVVGGLGPQLETKLHQGWADHLGFLKDHLAESFGNQSRLNEAHFATKAAVDELYREVQGLEYRLTMEIQAAQAWRQAAATVPMDTSLPGAVPTAPLPTTLPSMIPVHTASIPIVPAPQAPIPSPGGGPPVQVPTQIPTPTPPAPPTVQATGAGSSLNQIPLTQAMAGLSLGLQGSDPLLPSGPQYTVPAPAIPTQNPPQVSPQPMAPQVPQVPFQPPQPPHVPVNPFQFPNESIPSQSEGMGPNPITSPVALLGRGLSVNLTSHDKALLKFEGEQPFFNMTRQSWPNFKRLVIDWLSTVRPTDQHLKGAMLLTCLPKTIRDTLRAKLQELGIDPQSLPGFQWVWHYLLERFDDSSSLTPLARFQALTCKKWNGFITLDTWDEYQDEFNRRMSDLGYHIDPNKALQLIYQQLPQAMKTDLCAKEAKSSKLCYHISNLNPEVGLHQLRLGLGSLGFGPFTFRAYDGHSVEILPSESDAQRTLSLNGALFADKKIKVKKVAWRMDCQDVFDFIRNKLRAQELAFHKAQIASGVPPKASTTAALSAPSPSSSSTPQTSKGHAPSGASPLGNSNPFQAESSQVVCFIHGQNRSIGDTLKQPMPNSQGGGFRYRCKMGKECPNLKPSGAPQTFGKGASSSHGQPKAPKPTPKKGAIICWECQKAGKPSNHDYKQCQYAQNILKEKAHRAAKDKGKAPE